MPAARRHDINTSHAAARSVHKPSEVQQRILSILRKSAWSGDRTGLTDEQIIAQYKEQFAADVVPTEQSIRSRRAELVAAGKVRRSLAPGKSGTGRPSAKWTTAA